MTGLRRHQRRTEALARRARDEGRAGREHPLLGLQRAIGNRAVTGAIATGLGTRSPLPAMSDGRRLPPIGPALDKGREREADAVAKRALERLGPDAPQPLPAPAAHGLPPALRAALAPDLGDLGHVRFDANSALASKLGARAYADGPRVAFAPGELDYSSRAGLRLAAHESAHVALHAPHVGASGEHLVHAKLRTNHKAEDSEGERLGERLDRAGRHQLPYAFSDVPDVTRDVYRELIMGGQTEVLVQTAVRSGSVKAEQAEQVMADVIDELALDFSFRNDLEFRVQELGKSAVLELFGRTNEAVKAAFARVMSRVPEAEPEG